MDFSPSVPDAINAAAAEYGIDPAFMARVAELESSGDPGKITGSHRGLFQLSPDVWQKFGNGDIYNALDNARAAARSLAANRANFIGRFGRNPSQTELYLAHQQGMGGLVAHLTHPDAPAWRNMAGTAQGRAKSGQWAKRAIWGNIPGSMKPQLGNVNNVSGRQFIEIWRRRIEGGMAPMPVPRPRPPSAPRGSLDQPQTNPTDDGEASASLFGSNGSVGKGGMLPTFGGADTIPAYGAAPPDTQVPGSLQADARGRLPGENAFDYWLRLLGLTNARRSSFAPTSADDFLDTLLQAQWGGGGGGRGGPFAEPQSDLDSYGGFPAPIAFGGATTGPGMPDSRAFASPASQNRMNSSWTPAAAPQTNAQQVPAIDPAAIDLLPPGLRILAPYFFPQGFSNG